MKNKFWYCLQPELQLVGKVAKINTNGYVILEALLISFKLKLMLVYRVKYINQASLQSRKGFNKIKKQINGYES
jgi:hypothetical protein